MGRESVELAEPLSDKAKAPLSALIQTLSSPRARRSWGLRLVWGALLVLGLMLLITQVLLVSQGPTDFCQDYLAAQHLLQGHSPYSPVHCWIGISNVPTTVEYDPHPPASVLLASPFGLLPRLGATLLWGFFCLAAYLVTGWLLLKEVGWRSWPGAALFVFASAVWPPLRLSLSLQNFAEVVLLLLVGAWLLERRGHHRWAGLLIGLAGLLKLWPALLLLGALIHRRWGVARSGALTLALGSLLTLLALGPRAIADYLGTVQANERAWVPNEVNLSLVGIVTRPLTGYHERDFMIPPLLRGVSLSGAVLLGEMVAGVLLLGMLFFLWSCLRRSESALTEMLSYGLLVTILLLVFPVTWYWAMITLLIPCTTLLLALRQLPKPPTWWWLALQIALLFPFGVAWLFVWLANGLLTGPPNTLTGWVTLLYDVPTAALLLFAGLQGWLFWQIKPPPSHPSS